MSEKRSWDIQPRRKPSAAQPPMRPEPARPIERPVQQAHQRRRAEKPQRAQRTQSFQPQRSVAPRTKEKPMPEPQARAIRRQPAVPTGRDREPLKERRKRARRRAITSLSVLAVIVVVAIFGSFWLNFFRVQNVEAAGPDSQAVQSIATSDLGGTYHYIAPRNSFFFLPTEQIRADILKQYPDIAAVSISHVSLNTIYISSVPREAALTWCGGTYAPLPPDVTTQTTISSSTPDTASALPSCYSADAQGFIFAPITDPSVLASSLRIYGPLANGADTSSPLGATIAQANLIPNALQFIKAIKSLGVPIVAFVIRGDEADLYAQSGTRITYVLGREEVTAQVAESAFPLLNLNDGSLEYVDLRFEGKAYFKKVGADAATAASST